MADNAQAPTLIALGDSITAGVGGRWNRGYPYHLHKLLQPHIPNLKLINWGIPGLTIPRLTRALQKGEHLHEQLKNAHSIVMTIGGNDIIDAMPRALSDNAMLTPELKSQLVTHYHELMNTLSGLVSGPIYLGDIYNPFPLSLAADAIISRINHSCLYPLAARHRPLRTVRISGMLRGQEANSIQYYKTGTPQDLKKFWKKPIHPNDQGHAMIAEAFAHAMLSL